MIDKSKMVKVGFYQPDSSAVAVESMWAKPVENLIENPLKWLPCEILNIPFFAYDISCEDVVIACVKEKGELVFDHILQRSGHSTFRIILEKEYKEAWFNPKWKPLGDLGCTFERANAKLIAIDVPSGVNVDSVEKALVNGEQLGAWQYEVGHRFDK